MRREVLEEIYRLVGLTLPEGKRVEVVFQSGSNGTWGFTQARSWGALIIVQLSHPQKFVHGERPLFQHEMMHALQNAWIENHLGRFFPDWIFEGLATYVGGHGPHKTRESLARSGSRMINGLGRHSFGASSDYAEGYLAFLYLEHLAGEGAVKTFVRDITIQRTPWKESLKKLTGMEFAEFSENAKQFSLDYIAQVGRPRMSRDKLQTEDLAPPQLAQKRDAAKPDDAGTPAPGDDAAAHPAWRTFGLVLQSVDGQAIRELKNSANAAFVVVGVDDESAGAKAGLEVGDVVTSVNGASVGNAAALQPLLDGVKAGTEFKLEIFRGGKNSPFQSPQARRHETHHHYSMPDRAQFRCADALPRRHEFRANRRAGLRRAGAQSRRLAPRSRAETARLPANCRERADRRRG
jgi:hypothetical protein